MRIRDYLTSLLEHFVIMALALVTSIILIIPIVAIVFGLTFCLNKLTGLSPDSSGIIVMGFIALLCFAVGVYIDRKKQDQWQASLEAADQNRSKRGPYRSFQLRHQHSTYSLVLKPPAGSDEPEELVAQIFMTNEDLAEHNCIIPYELELLLRWAEDPTNYLKEVSDDANRD